jgi:hypothetical protein
MGLYVGTQTSARQRLGHGAQVARQQVALDNQCRRGQVARLHDEQRTEPMDGCLR